MHVNNNNTYCKKILAVLRELSDLKKKFRKGISLRHDRCIHEQEVIFFTVKNDSKMTGDSNFLLLLLGVQTLCPEGWMQCCV